MRWFKLAAIAAVVAVAVAVALPVAAQDQTRAGRTVDAGRLFAAGGDVRVVDGAADDAFVAGSRVNILGTYAQNVFLAGGDVIVTGTVVRNTYLGGNFVSVEGKVGHDLYAAGRSVTIQEGAEVTGNAYLAGATVDVAGGVGGSLRTAASAVTIEGTVAGDVTARAGTLRIGPRARITGTLRYSADRPAEISPTAIIGAVEVLPAPTVAPIDATTTIVNRLVRLVAWVVAFTVLAGVLHLAVPGLLSSGADQFSVRPVASFGLGLGLTVGLPLAGVLLLITLIGIPVALLLWFFGVILSALGSAVAAYWIGLRFRGFTTVSLQEPAFWGRVFWTKVGFLVIGFITWVPWAGDLLVWIAYTIATGAVFHAMWVRFRAPAPVPHHI